MILKRFRAFVFCEDRARSYQTSDIPNNRSRILTVDVKVEAPPAREPAPKIDRIIHWRVSLEGLAATRDLGLWAVLRSRRCILFRCRLVATRKLPVTVHDERFLG